MKKTLIIFDVDDTLLNSMKLDSQAFSQTYHDMFGQPLATIDWSKYPHVTDTTIFNTAYKTLHGHLPSQETIHDFRNSFVDRIINNRKNQPESFHQIPGAKSIVNLLLASENYLVGIATGGWMAPAKTKLLHFGFSLNDIHDSYADDKVTREEILEESIRKASQNHEINRSVYVGDAIWDVRTTRNMSLDFVGIRFRGDSEVLYKEGAKVVIQDYLDRSKFFEAIENARPPGPIK